MNHSDTQADTHISTSNKDISQLNITHEPLSQAGIHNVYLAVCVQCLLNHTAMKAATDDYDNSDVNLLFYSKNNNNASITCIISVCINYILQCIN